MFRTVSIRITQTLINCGCIPKENVELYSYGFHQLFMMLLNISITLVLGIVLNEFWQSVVLALLCLSIMLILGKIKNLLIKKL